MRSAKAGLGRNGVGIAVLVFFKEVLQFGVGRILDLADRVGRADGNGLDRRHAFLAVEIVPALAGRRRKEASVEHHGKLSSHQFLAQQPEELLVANPKLPENRLEIIRAEGVPRPFLRETLIDEIVAYDDSHAFGVVKQQPGVDRLLLGGRAENLLDPPLYRDGGLHLLLHLGLLREFAHRPLWP